ncbi:hypothetical protein QIA31_05535 (plasmid) [Borreliella turdi]
MDLNITYSNINGTNSDELANKVMDDAIQKIDEELKKLDINKKIK